jgi:hypothetical protein
MRLGASTYELAAGFGNALPDRPQPSNARSRHPIHLAHPP